MKLTRSELAQLFEGPTRFVERLAQADDPLGRARALLRSLSEDEIVEALNAHPRIGAGRLSATSAAEQGTDEDPAVLADLVRLNAAYEQKFGFRFVVFVNRRPRRVIRDVLRERLVRTRAEELDAAIDALVSIAEDRYRRMGTGNR